MQDNTSISCPGCGAEMSTSLEHGITIDFCGECGGVWLDSGELEELTGGTVHVDPDAGHSRDEQRDEESEPELEDELGGVLQAIVDTVLGDDDGGDTSDGENDRSSGEMDGRPMRTSIGRNTSYLSGPVAERHHVAERPDRTRPGDGQRDEAVNWELVRTLLQAQGAENDPDGGRRPGPDIVSANVTIRFTGDDAFDWSLERALESGSLSHLDVESEQFRAATDDISEWADRHPENAAALVLEPEQALADALGPEAGWVSDVAPRRSMSEPVASGQIASLRVETESTSLEGD